MSGDLYWTEWDRNQGNNDDRKIRMTVRMGRRTFKKTSVVLKLVDLAFFNAFERAIPAGRV